MTKFISLLCCVALLTGCAIFGGGDREDLKSPCVGTEGSPCADHKRGVNDWWLT